jgi:hypothetical protein
MKISQICAVALLVVLGSAMAFADGIQDPKIIIRGVNGGNVRQDCRQGCVDVGSNFSFQVPKGGSGSLFFTNTSGKNWTSLSLIETGEPAADISCVQNVFLNCSVKTLKNGSVEILLSGVKHSLNPRVGIPNGGSFEISFNCAGGCWVNGGSTVVGHGGAAPEPETVALMMTGLGAIISQRKRWLNRLKS